MNDCRVCQLIRIQQEVAVTPLYVVSLLITVKPSIVSFPPSVVTRDIESPVMLQCRGFGIPMPNITWFRNSRVFQTSTSARYV